MANCTGDHQPGRRRSNLSQPPCFQTLRPTDPIRPGYHGAMPRIRQVEDGDNDPEARRELDAARQRAGRVWNIVRVMTPNPPALRASMQFYAALMHGPSPLARWRRELLAVVTSRRNGCVY